MANKATTRKSGKTGSNLKKSAQKGKKNVKLPARIKGKQVSSDDVNQKQIEISKFLNGACAGRSLTLKYKSLLLKERDKITFYSGPLNKDISFRITIEADLIGKKDATTTVDLNWIYSLLFTSYSIPYGPHQSQYYFRQIAGSFSQPNVSDKVSDTLFVTNKKDQNMDVNLVVDRSFNRNTPAFIYMSNIIVTIKVDK